MDTDWNQITESIIGCAFKVANALGHGFMEKVYENALAFELRRNGFEVMQQVPLSVFYEGHIVGEYVADLIVNGVIVELKAIKTLDDVHSAQCINYLAATKFPICLLVNFSRKVEVKRFVSDTYRSHP